jgi:hypothetical protein
MLKINSGYVLKIGNFPMSWCGKIQSMVALFLTKVKCHALMEGFA